MDDHPARLVTLQRHILESQKRHARSTGELSVPLTQLAYAGKSFAHALGRAPLVGRLGPAAGTNVQGEGRVPLTMGGRVEVARVDEFMGSGA